MADAITVLWILLGGFFFAGWGILLVTSTTMARSARRTDPAVAQLRVFRHHARLSKGMILLGVGTVGGFLASTPWLILILQSGGALTPLAFSAWTLAWTVLWSVSTCRGFLTLSRVFSIEEERRP